MLLVVIVVLLFCFVGLLAYLACCIDAVCTLLAAAQEGTDEPLYPVLTPTEEEGGARA